MAASSLTAEQLKRIECNRAEAMRRIALRQQREKELRNIKNITVANNNYSNTAISSTSIVSSSVLDSLNSPNKVSVTVRDENKKSVQEQVIATNDNEIKFPPITSSSSSSSPTKYVITYRDEQEPSTSTLSLPSKAKVDHKQLSVLSSVKPPSVTTTVQLKQSVVNIVFKLFDSKSFQVSYIYNNINNIVSFTNKYN